MEDQQISEDIVSSTIPEYVDEQVAKIGQQVLNRGRLMEISEKLNLFSESKAEDVARFVDKMKKNIVLEATESDISSSESQRKGPPIVTTAFKLSYQGDDPHIVQKVTATLADLFLEEDIKRRERVVSATNEFLKAEQERLKSEINAYEKKISEFKQAHLHELPEDQGSNLQAISRLERELDQNENRVQLLQEKEMLLNSQLAKVEPLTPIVVEGSNISTNPNQRLKELYLQLTRLRSVYSEKHPDIKKIKNEIKELETQVKHSDTSVVKVKRLNQLEDQLAEMQRVYGPEHPEVKVIKREIAILKPEVDNLLTEAAKIKISEERPDNPAYISLVTQTNAIKMEIQALQADSKQIAQDIVKFQKRIEKAPFVEKELNALRRDLESAQDKYSEISSKLLEARVSKELESMQKAQRFSITSSAYLPVEPFKPDRLLIILLGFVSALVVSSLFVALREGMDDSLKTTDQIKAITGVPVLTSVSYIVTSEEMRSRRLKKFIWSLAVFLAFGVLLIVVNQFIMSFDDLVLKFDQIWTIILERIKMIA
jgi:uncharacterized protein involved in exopolysaccharide biosynthesis